MKEKTLSKALKTKHIVDRKYGIAYCRKLKKKSFLKNEKVANRKLGNLGNVIPSFPISKFSILAIGQNRKLKFKNLGKKFPSFPSFQPGRFLRLFRKTVNVNENIVIRNRYSGKIFWKHILERYS